jgi:hypothetical protein
MPLLLRISLQRPPDHVRELPDVQRLLFAREIVPPVEARVNRIHIVLNRFEDVQERMGER